MLATTVLIAAVSLLTTVHGKIFPLPPPSCAVSKYTINDFTNHTVLTNDNPLAPLEAPSISGMNGTNWDYWYFDATDIANPKAGIVVAFWRSCPVGDINQAPLRVDVYATTADGTAYKDELYVEESWVVSCFDQYYGVWNSSDGQAVSFEIDAQMKESTIVFDTKTMKGTYVIRSDSDPRILNNEPLGSPNSKFQMSPGFYWTEPIPLGNVTANIAITGNKQVSKLTIEGRGGHDRNWGTRLIPELAETWYFIRMWIGPYKFIYYEVTTDLWATTNGTYTSAILFQGNETVFTSHTVPGQTVSTSVDDYTVFNMTTGGPTKASHYNPTTGYDVTFVSPSRGTQWKFSSNHTSILYMLPPNAYEETVYRTNVGYGGVKGGPVYTGGVGITQECEHLGAIPGQL